MNLDVLTKFRQSLEAETAGNEGGIGLVAGDGDFGEVFFAFRDGFEQGDTFGTDRGASDVFDVAACVDCAVLTQKCGTDFELRVWSVGVLCGDGGDF